MRPVTAGAEENFANTACLRAASYCSSKMAATKPGAGGRGAVTVAMSNALSDIYRKEETYVCPAVELNAGRHSPNATLPRRIRRAHLDKQLEEILAEDPNVR